MKTIEVLIRDLDAGRFVGDPDSRGLQPDGLTVWTRPFQPDDEVRAHAVAELISIGEGCIEPLTQDAERVALSSEDPGIGIAKVDVVLDTK